MQNLLIVTDAAASANSSTTREVVDIVRECEKNGVNTHVYSASVTAGDCYLRVTHGTYSWVPFYKSRHLLLRFISENLLGISLALKFLFFHKNKRAITNVLWISPSIFTIYLVIAVRCTTNAHVYLMLRDMFPYWLANIGRLKRNGIVYKLLNQFAKLQMRISTTIGVESEKSQEIFLKLFPQNYEKCEILFNWMESEPLQYFQKPSGSQIRFVYAGNLGFAQGAELIEALICHYKNSNDVEFHMIGRGDGFSALSDLKSKLQVNNLFFHDQLPVDQIDNFIRQYDIGLVFLKSDLNASNIPGKVMGYLLNGLPVLGSVNPESDVAALIYEHSLGFIDVSGSAIGLISLAEKILSNYRAGEYRPERIRGSSMQLFSPSVALEKILN